MKVKTWIFLKTVKTKLAHYISIIGHPILTISVFAIVSFFKNEPVQKALFHSLLIVGAIAIPLLVKMYRGSRNGTYSNFDISNKTERQSWYLFPIAILILVTVFLYLTHQSREWCLTMLFSLAILIVSNLVNFFIKSSLHISFNIFLSFLLFAQNVFFGVFFLTFTILIAWSRFVLKRHSIKEIIAGAVIGFAIGTLALILI